MWETILFAWQNVGTGAAWAVTICLLVAGAIGCVLPVLPGHLIILIAAIAHWLMLRGDSGLRWWSFVILVVLMAISQTFEMLSGAAGSKWFGGTRWGAIGAAWVTCATEGWITLASLWVLQRTLDSPSAKPQ